MRMRKKKRWLSLKEILFSYLALSKVLYWLDMTTGVEQGDFLSIFEPIWLRMLDRDFLLIALVILLFLLEKLIEKKSKINSIYKWVIFYAIGYAGMVGLFYGYSWIMSFIFTVEFPPLLTFIAESILGYIVVVIILNIKIYFKSKEKGAYKADVLDQDADNSLAMLKALLNRGILTQEEFDQKKKMLPATDAF